MRALNIAISTKRTIQLTGMAAGEVDRNFSLPRMLNVMMRPVTHSRVGASELDP